MITKSLDLETFLIERNRPAPVPVCLSWYDGHRGAVIPHGDALVSWIERQLQDPTVHLVGHNVAFDFKCLLALEPDRLGPLIFAAYAAGRITDTMIRQQLFFIATRPSFDDSVPAYSLARLVALIFDDVDLSAGKGPDAWRMRYGELYGVPFDRWPQEAIDYPLSDAEWTWKCWHEQETKAGGRIRCDALMAEAAFVLSIMESRGMRTDPLRVDALERRWRAEAERLRPVLLEAGLLKYEGPKKDPMRKLVKKDKPARAMMAAAWERLHEQQRADGAGDTTDPYLTDAANKRKFKRKDYVPTENDLSIARAACIATGDELLLDRARYVLAEKILSTFLPPMRAGTEGPITTRFNLASTMRTTSGTPKEPAVGTNMQNSPRSGGVRECLIARYGYALWMADLSMAELHNLAEVCKRKLGYSTLGDVLNSGEDAHLYLASKLLDTSFDDVKARYAQGDPEAKKARQMAKPGNFGFGGAMGWRKFILYNLNQGQLYRGDEPSVDAMRFTPERAKALRQAWLDAYPEMQDYFDACKAELGPTGQCVIELWPGGPLRRVQGLSMICNSYFQAPAAYGGKLGIIAIMRECHRGRLSRLHPCNYVHDEAVGELEISEHMHEDAMLAAKIFEDAFNKVVPNYPTTVEPVLATHYSKGAEPVYDAAGRLTLWTPKEIAA